jgi:hypothetical protein
MEVVSKVLLNGVNIVKKLPKFIEFLEGLGISI